MTQLRPPEPIPALDYFEQRNEESFYLLRLLLIAASLGSLIAALSAAVTLTRGLGSLAQPMMFFYLGVGLLLPVACALFGTACLCCALGRFGATFAVWTAVARVVAQFVYSTLTTLDYITRMRGATLQATFLASYVSQSFLSVISAAVLPVIVIIALRRPTVKQMIRG